ncbi:hypothetical protein QBC46DRAFT_261583 [Diplogelasinospora grovesii]|uniref:Methyltransferase n=1 Tax=Diplogelasinospora grovesii TaxID=303347 RepID=A0AAN6N6M5_9PEZI|nr:hypothetical protein QBC46DRAFT_261583 [Diplogelasinospora grovesii]
MATEVLTPQAHVFVEPHDVADTDNAPKRPHNVATSLNYWKDPGDGSPPTPIIVGRGTISNRRPTIAQPVVVTDVTGEEDKYTLDSHGFQYLRSTSNEKDFTDESKILAEYYPECEQLLKDVTGASRVKIFDHKVRRGPTQWHGLGANNLANRGPVTRVHVDQSYDGAEMVLRRRLPDEADDLVTKRYQIINVWRPIKTILKDPIAVADATSIPDEDLVAARSMYDSHQGETWTLRPNAAHRFYFKYRLTPEEVLFIKCFDSDIQAKARRVPHSAFEDPEHKDQEYRQSVEVRCLVFYDH